MTDTLFGPLPAEIAARCAPTELDQDTDTHLKGVATTSQPASWAASAHRRRLHRPRRPRSLPPYMLAPATSQRRAGFGSEWITRSLTIQTGELRPTRGLFWHPSPGTTTEEDVWVHYGFTGTGMWISPTKDRWACSLPTSFTTPRPRTADRHPQRLPELAFR
ncbi:hypothetical protein GCM10017687_14300 [Streptomyces echinatus]